MSKVPDINHFLELANRVLSALGNKANADHSHLSDMVYAETSSSATVRTVTIPGVTSWDDIKDIPIHIKAATYGTTSSSTLNINSLGAKSIYFPTAAGSGLTTTPIGYYWVRTNGVYTVVWDGTYLKILNPQVRSASTSYQGVVQLSSSVSDSSTSKAATPSAVKSAYDLANTANTAANTATEDITALKARKQSRILWSGAVVNSGTSFEFFVPRECFYNNEQNLTLAIVGNLMSNYSGTGDSAEAYGDNISIVTLTFPYDANGGTNLANPFTGNGYSYAYAAQKDIFVQDINALYISAIKLNTTNYAKCKMYLPTSNAYTCINCVYAIVPEELEV